MVTVKDIMPLMARYLAYGDPRDLVIVFAPENGGDAVIISSTLSYADRTDLHDALVRSDYFEIGENIYRLLLDTTIIIFRRMHLPAASLLIGYSMEKSNTNRLAITEMHLNYLLDTYHE
jgi:hypothetical protein